MEILETQRVLGGGGRPPHPYGMGSQHPPHPLPGFPGGQFKPKVFFQRALVEGDPPTSLSSTALLASTGDWNMLWGGRYLAFFLPAT